MFEIIRRDGLARIGKFTTKSGRTMETPALLPVVNPKIRTVEPRELYDRFGFRALITNSYIIRNTPKLKEEAQEKGLHELLDFPGVIMTDSGTFQSHMYGEVEVTNEEIVEFQKSIGTDIGTVLDIFTEPDWSHEKTKRSLETTLERTEQACGMKGDMMINGVVQGSVYTDLREYSASAMAPMDVDVHPIGGVVPLMEQYRYAELVDVVMASKKGLNPSRPVHLFGCGHPMLLALATLMGCDLFDSASYALYARDDRLMDVTGTHRLQDMQSLDCNCPACRGITIEELRRMDKSKRSKLIAEHNLYQITEELATVRRYLREGRLWELAEIRCRSHPALLDGLRRLREYQGQMELYDPISREGAVFYTGPESRNRPVYKRYLDRIGTRYPGGARRDVPPCTVALPVDPRRGDGDRVRETDVPVPPEGRIRDRRRGGQGPGRRHGGVRRRQDQGEGRRQVPVRHRSRGRPVQGARGARHQQEDREDQERDLGRGARSVHARRRRDVHP